MSGAIPPLPNTPLWRGAQLKHRDNFTFSGVCTEVCPTNLILVCSRPLQSFPYVKLKSISIVNVLVWNGRVELPSHNPY
jgi:hypothetical protein